MSPSPLSIERRPSGSTVRDSTGRAVLVDASAAVELTDGTLLTTLHGVQPGGPLALSWQVTTLNPGVLGVRLRVTNGGDAAIPLGRIELIRARMPVVHPRQIAVTQIGWQSWSPAGSGLLLASVSGSGDPPLRGPRLPARRPPGPALPWAAGVEMDGHVLLGFASARRRMGMVSVAPSGGDLQVTAWEPAEEMVIPPRGRLDSEELVVVSAGTVAELWAAYGEAAGRAMGARTGGPVPTGWCSWYGLGANISEELVARAVEHLKHSSLAVAIVQIDDGYQVHCGDWLTPNDRFPNGLASLARRIARAGFRPGLWFAPFLISERSSLYHAHPDWVVRDAAGEAAPVIHLWDARQFALDTTHPAARGWLGDVVRTITDAWGFSYLKADFLYAGGLPGRRRERVGSIEAYRRGLRTIRDAAGDAFILGCGAPLLSSVGLVDGMRVGPDVKPYWTVPSGGDPERGTLRDAIRSVLAHGWTHRRLWTLDPDCALLHGRDGALTPAEVRTWLTVVAMCGGATMLGDDPERLRPADLALLNRLLPPSGRAAESIGPYVEGLPTALVLSGDPLRPGWHIVAVFNWTDRALTHALDLARLGISGPRHLFDLWEGTYHGLTAIPADLPAIPPHGVRLLALSPPHHRPQVVGSTLHLFGGAIDVRDEHWAEDTLTVRLHCPGVRAGSLAVVVTENYALREGAGMDDLRRSGGLVTASVHFQDSAALRLSLKRAI